MTPAFSLVVFTTLSGFGFGLMAWLGFGLGAHSAAFAWISVIVAYAAALTGLYASTRRLMRPERAFFTLSQWRTSWLSREGLLAIATLGLFGLYAVPWLLFGVRIGVLGLLATVSAVATVYATGMIYRVLETVPRWATPLTPACFVAFALASGALGDAMLTDLTARDDGGRADGAAIFLLLMAFALKWAWWERAKKLDAEAPGGAAAETDRAVRRLEPPKGAQTWLMKEMAFAVGRQRAPTLRRVAVALGLVVPIVCVDLSGRFGAIFVPIGLAAHILGLMAERWLFFAEAEHVVTDHYDGGAREAAE